MRTIAVDWEYEVPIEEVESARTGQSRALEAYFGVGLDRISDLEIARYLVRTAHPTSRYLRAGVQGLGFA